MSASVKENNSQVIPIGISPSTHFNSTNSTVPFENDSAENIVSAFYKLEKFVLASRGFEEDLFQAKKKCKKLEEELHQTQSTLERLLKEAKTRNYELETESAKTKAALAQYQNMEKSFRNQIQWFSDKLKFTQKELFQYKTAWAEVLQREKEAKLIILEGRKNEERLQEVERQFKTLNRHLAEEKAYRARAERHAESYQAELQSALVQIHSSEAQYNELHKELQALKASNREQETYRGQMQKKVRAELENDFIFEKERLITAHQKLHEENVQLRKILRNFRIKGQ